jgi:ferredoxin
MINSLKGLLLTLVSTVNGFRKPVTRQYPATGTLWSRTAAPTPVQPRFMGFPALTWDDQVGEPYCTSCMVCIRQCPTQCMTATMKDNPLQQEGLSKRRKIVNSFEINLNRYTLRDLRGGLQFRRHCYESRTRNEHLPEERRPGGPSRLVANRLQVSKGDRLDSTYGTG